VPARLTQISDCNGIIVDFRLCLVSIKVSMFTPKNQSSPPGELMVWPRAFLIDETHLTASDFLPSVKELRFFLQSISLKSRRILNVVNSLIPFWSYW
jgi:hypothetical protein